MCVYYFGLAYNPLAALVTNLYIMIDDKDILAQEIQSCDSFKYALREENTLLSNKILKEGQKEEEGSTKAVNFKRSEFHS